MRWTSDGKPTGTYNSWREMRRRCQSTKPKYFSNYAGRGISICERWERFENFLADMGERPPGTSIDRINNDGIYEPSNCRWATKAQQTRNTRVAKLNETIVAALRRGEVSIREVTEAFGCSMQVAWLAKTGKTWK